MNIRELDNLVRDIVYPKICELVSNENYGFSALSQCIQDCVRQLKAEMGEDSFSELTINLSPYLKIGMGKNMAQILLKQKFEFSASHRLHAHDLSFEENKEIFGKCNHESGHGHNYVMEVGVSYDVETAHLSIGALDELVDETVVSQFDHKHLNEDCPQFAKRNPTVENISVVIYQMLKSPLQDQLQCQLEEVTVWETGKTSCTYSE